VYRPAHEVRRERESDAVAAIDRLLAADETRDRDELRRALAATLGEFYRWRVFECGEYSQRTGTVTKHLGGVSQDGELLEGLILWRDIVEHHPEQLVDLREYDIFPSDDLFPSDGLFPGANLSIAASDEEPQRIADDKHSRREVFRTRIAGQPLFPILSACVTFLSSVNVPRAR
jgi:hypothetical protein